MNKSWFITLLYICLQFEEPRTPVCSLGHLQEQKSKFQKSKVQFWIDSYFRETYCELHQK